MEKAKAFETIVTNLNILRYIIYSKVRNGLYDVNKKSEGFFKDLLNKVYNWELENLNAQSLVYPGIDLGSSKDKISVQVTSQTGSKKVEQTLALFDKHEHSKHYDRLIVFNIAKKTNHSKDFVSNTISFDKKSDILDIDDLLYHLEHAADTPKMKEIEAYILQEIPYFNSKLTSPNDLLSHRADYRNTKPKNYGRIEDKFSKEGIHDSFEEFKQIAETVFERLSTRSQNERKGLIPLLTKSTPPDLELLLSTWGNIMVSSFQYSEQDVRSIVHALEDAKLSYNDEDDTHPKLKILADQFWLEVLEILSRDELVDLVLNLNFSTLDK